MAIVPDDFHFDPEARAELLAVLPGPKARASFVIEALEATVYEEMLVGADEEPPRRAFDALSDLDVALEALREAVLAVQASERASELVRWARVRLGEAAPFSVEALDMLRRWDSIFSAFAGGPDLRPRPPAVEEDETVFDALSPAAFWQVFAERGLAGILDQAKPAAGRPPMRRRDRIARSAARILERHGITAPHREGGVLVLVLPRVLEALGETMPDDLRRLLARVNAG